MTLYRDQVLRMPLSVVRARFPPRIFRGLQRVRLEAGDASTDVELVRVPATGIPSGWATAMRCPACQRTTTVVGITRVGVPAPRWGCAVCLQWRGRARRTPSSFTNQEKNHEEDSP